MNWDIKPGAANDGRPNLRFLRMEYHLDIDGRPHTLIVNMETKPYFAEIVRDFDKAVVWRGLPPPAPFGIEPCLFIAEQLKIGLV